MINHLLSIIVLVAFFGVYPRELQQNAPTVFALLSVFIYCVHKKIWDTIDSKRKFKENMKTIEEQSKEIKKFQKILSRELQKKHDKTKE